MTIIKKATVTTRFNGTFDIQVEDWSKDYPDTFMLGSSLAAYPVSKVDTEAYFGPKRGRKFRCDFHFPDGNKAMKAFEALIEGKAELSDYLEYINRRDYIPCVTGSWEVE